MSQHVWFLFLERISRFYYAESCGQCTPCREGTGWLYKTLMKIKSGKGQQSDLDLLDRVANQIEGHCICALGDAAAMPVKSFLKNFWNEFEYYVDKKTINGNLNVYIHQQKRFC